MCKKRKRFISINFINLLLQHVDFTKYSFLHLFTHKKEEWLLFRAHRVLNTSPVYKMHILSQQPCKSRTP